MQTVKKFTERSVELLKHLPERYEVRESSGLYIRVSKFHSEEKKLKKTWAYRFKFQGKAIRMTLGHYPSTGLVEARRLMSEAELLKDKGINPIQHAKEIEEEAKKKQQEEKQTVKWLANEFYEKNLLKNRKAPEQAKRIIDSDIIPLLGKIKLTEITTKKITTALDKIVSRGSNVMANRTLNIIKQMFRFGVSRGDIETDPAGGIKAIDIGGMEIPKDRSLSYKDIKKVWLWLSNDKTKLHPATSIALKILLLTGVRSGELRLATWQEFDFENNLWTIPPEHIKSKKGKKPPPHKVHLAPLVKELFFDLKELSGCNYVLPAKTQDKPLTDKVLARAVARNYEDMAVDKWTPHDLRRTFNTELSGLGIEPYIVEKCLGHRLQGMMGVYNQQEYLPQRMNALELWSKTITNLVENENVVILKKRGLE